MFLGVPLVVLVARQMSPLLLLCNLQRTVQPLFRAALLFLIARRKRQMTQRILMAQQLLLQLLLLQLVLL